MDIILFQPTNKDKNKKEWLLLIDLILFINNFSASFFDTLYMLYVNVDIP